MLSVITGDIVASRKIPAAQRDKLYADTRKFLASLKSEKRITTFGMFRGDSIQCVASNNEEALKTALMIRAWIKAYNPNMAKTNRNLPAKRASKSVDNPLQKHDIRLSIGIGAVDFYKKNSLAHSDGEAFQLSGLGLDALKGSPGKTILQSGDKSFNEIMEVISLLLDAVIEKWTDNQAEIILFKLKNYKEEQIAREIGISQSAVNQRTKSSQWAAIEKLLIWFEKTVRAW